MTLQFINPDGLPTPTTYTHVIVATGTKMVFIAGQEPEDAQGSLVGPGDLAAQARQVFAISAAPSPPPVPARDRSPRLRSTSLIIGPSTCQ